MNTQADKIFILHRKNFPASTGAYIFTSPGRVELVGNNTDLTGGAALASTIEQRILAACEKTSNGKITILSEGFRPVEVDVSDIVSGSPDPEIAISDNCCAIVRGVALSVAELAQSKHTDLAMGGEVPTFGGFRATTTSSIVRSAGLSSSAAFAVFVASALNTIWLDNLLEPIELAQCASLAEKKTYGKPNGGFDAATCALGGVCFLSCGQITMLDTPLSELPFSLMITNTFTRHSKQTDHLSQMLGEVEKVREFFGVPTLNDLDEKQLTGAFGEIRRQGISDRAILRSLFLVRESKRVFDARRALEDEKVDAFLDLVGQSGTEEISLFQNAFVPGDEEEPLLLAIETARRALGVECASRIGGTGFSGCIQTWVPRGAEPIFAKRMDAVFGEKSTLPVQFGHEGTKCRGSLYL